MQARVHRFLLVLKYKIEHAYVFDLPWTPLFRNQRRAFLGQDDFSVSLLNGGHWRLAGLEQGVEDERILVVCLADSLTHADGR